MRRIWVVLLALALASGCADGQQPPLPTLVAVASLPSATPTFSPPTATATATPTSSPTPLPTPTSTPSATPCPPGRVEPGEFASVLIGNGRFRIYLPPCYGENGRLYPTLYLLPGNIHSDAIWDTVGIDEAAETGIRSGTIPPLLIVMADGGQLANNSSGGPGSYESLILNELIPHIEATYCAQPEATSRAIGGLSRGGYWALEIAFRHPSQFASVGGHSAALLDTYAGPNLNPQYTGLSQNLGNLRIYFDIGEDDWSIANIRRLHEEMAAAGVAHTWQLNPGGHDEAYWSAHTADYLAWYTAPWATPPAQTAVCQT